MIWGCFGDDLGVKLPWGPKDVFYGWFLVKNVDVSLQMMVFEEFMFHFMMVLEGSNQQAL